MASSQDFGVKVMEARYGPAFDVEGLPGVVVFGSPRSSLEYTERNGHPEVVWCSPPAAYRVPGWRNTHGPEYDVPQELEQFDDVSYANDMNPSFQCGSMQIFVDMPNPEDRLEGEGSDQRYMILLSYNHEDEYASLWYGGPGCDDYLLLDDLQEVLDHVMWHAACMAVQL